MRVVWSALDDGDPDKVLVSCSAAPPCIAISARSCVPVDANRAAQPCATVSTFLEYREHTTFPLATRSSRTEDRSELN